MAITYVAIASTTVGSGGSANIEFTSIPATYTDLQIFATLRSTRSGTFDTVAIRFNGNLTNMSYRALEGRGSSNGISFFGTSVSYAGSINGSTGTASSFSNISIYVPGYTRNAIKSFSVDSVAGNNATGLFSGYQDLISGIWNDTSAITSIRLTPDNGSFVEHSTAILYGIKNA